MPTLPPGFTGLIAAVLASIVVAGCFDSNGATTLAAEPSVAFDGTGNGFHTHYAGCEDEGQASGSGTVTEGRVILRVTDSNGTELLVRSFDGNFALDPTTLNGHPGDWKMDTQRAGDDAAGAPFSGKYEFNLSC